MQKESSSERKSSSTVDELFLTDPYLSPTMRARLIHVKIKGEAYEEEYLKELLALAEEENTSPPLAAASAPTSITNSVQGNPLNLQDSKNLLIVKTGSKN